MPVTRNIFASFVSLQEILLQPVYSKIPAQIVAGLEQGEGATGGALRQLLGHLKRSGADRDRIGLFGEKDEHLRQISTGLLASHGGLSRPLQQRWQQRHHGAHSQIARLDIPVIGVGIKFVAVVVATAAVLAPDTD